MVFLSLIGNMDHNFADMMELVWVFVTIGISFAILLALGHWWQQ